MRTRLAALPLICRGVCVSVSASIALVFVRCGVRAWCVCVRVCEQMQAQYDGRVGSANTSLSRTPHTGAAAPAARRIQVQKPEAGEEGGGGQALGGALEGAAVGHQDIAATPVGKANSHSNITERGKSPDDSPLPPPPGFFRDLQADLAV
jgi:hypothetical protein